MSALRPKAHYASDQFLCYLLTIECTVLYLYDLIAYLFDSRQASLTKVAKNSEEILVKCQRDESDARLSKESPILKLTLCYYGLFG